MQQFLDVFILLKSLDSAAIVSFRCNPQASSQPLRPVLKKTSLNKPYNKVEEKFKNTEKENRISVPKRFNETEAKTEKSQRLPARLLQKKKTVAFGRTVNVSQTIEVFLQFQIFNVLRIFILNFEIASR